MADNTSELELEVRQFTDYSEDVLSSNKLELSIERAQQHIRSEKDITDPTFDWFGHPTRENALFWWSCLFCKVQVGELDSQSVTIGSIDIDSLLSKDDNEVTEWFRNAHKALASIDTGSDRGFGIGITGVAREDRMYGSDDDSDTDLGGLTE